MGGMGSGRHWYWGAKDSTDDYLSIDVRRWKRDGLLTPHQFFGWQWSRHGEVVASICVRTELDRLILTYRHRWGGEDWQDESYPVYLDWTACHLGSATPLVSLSHPWLWSARGDPLRRQASSPVGIATSWPTPASGKRSTIAWRGGRTESGTSWDGSPASSTAAGGNPRGCTGTSSSG